MKPQPKKEKIKSIITITIAIILVLLLIFAEDIVKIQNKNKIELSENTEEQITVAEPNIPKVSAGMIPIKWDGSYWTITTKNDAEWYDYANGKPAYIMLNDGIYQSELIRDMKGKKLAEENTGAQIQENELGSIFMWIPRFEINDDSGEIKYINNVAVAEEGWTIPELFTYKQTDETVPDFLLTGVWVQKDIDTSYSSKITEMNKEEGIYGFIANTVGVGVPDDPTYPNAISKYLVGAGLAYALDQITELTSTNRITLKIINDKNQDPIKASGTYNKDTGIITVQVTYSQYGIKQILLKQTNELIFSKTDGIITADTTGIELEDGENTIIIIDNKENKKELKVVVVGRIFATLYTDGTLAFGKSENPLPEKTISTKYGDISDKKYDNTIYNIPPWWNYRTNIKILDFVNKITPISTSYWCYNLENVTTINNLSNLNTKNVTDMSGMFYFCKNLTNLDVSSFDTSKVTNMDTMFYHCSNLTSIDVSNFDTSNVTNMRYMFGSCSSLASIDVSNFDTSNVTNMDYMFCDCSSLASIDIGSFNTSKVTDMRYMFGSCSSLASIDVGSFNTSKVTDMSGMFHACSGLTSIDIGSFNTSKVTDMSGMFNGCTGLTSIDVSNFDTSKVISMYCMFSNCRGLTSLDISNFDTSSVTDMTYMFSYCNNLISINVSNFDTSNVTNMNGMFIDCSNLSSIDVSSFDTSKVTNMSYMFYGCRSLTSLDISNFDTISVKNMSYMFYRCSTLKTIYVGSKWSLASSRSNMFTGCGTSSVTRI